MNSNRAKYLLVKHSRGWNVDRCYQWMEHNQRQYEWFYPQECDQFPKVDDYAGVIVFGGASSANDSGSCDWVSRELKFVENVLSQEVAFFGICLGAQMLARVLGSNITSHPNGKKEIGYHEVFPTPDSGDFLSQPQYFMQWHSEGFELPCDCTAIASGTIFPNQAFKYRDNVYGVQFHPEVNPQALTIWHERNKRKNPVPLTDEQRSTQRADALRYDQSITDWLNGFLNHWTAQHAA